MWRRRGRCAVKSDRDRDRDPEGADEHDRGWEPPERVALTVDLLDLWLIHECLSAHLAGFAIRDDEATRVARGILRKVRYQITRYDRDGYVERPRPGFAGRRETELDLTQRELEIIATNIPATATQNARAFLVRCFQALARFEWPRRLPLADQDEPSRPWRERLADWQAQHQSASPFDSPPSGGEGTVGGDAPRRDRPDRLGPGDDPHQGGRGEP
jgi:hypothetical protein